MTETFGGATIDRAGERRLDAAWVARRLANPASRAVLVTPGGVALDPVDESRLARLSLAEAPGERALLGLEDGRALFAAAGAAAGDGDGESARRVAGLRDVAATLAPAEAGLAAYASALIGWHREHPRCSRCGEPTVMAEAGHVRACPACGAQHHPRTDPVVIMLVTDGDRVLMGRQSAWPPRRYSALAGFVEPGESLEEAVAREVREESGVEISHPRYLASQPWPFPASLMLGFTARHAGGEPVARDAELEDVRWFTRAEVAAAGDEGDGPLLLPPSFAIARRLIDGWLAGERP